MPDHRQHRGPHPRDPDLFAAGNQPRLSQAVEHLAWLLERGYSELASLKLVGDHFSLTARQRQLVARASCSDAALSSRRARRAEPACLSGMALFVDGFNALICLESALSGALVFVGRDGVYRDLASVHGTYRTVTETPEAVRLLFGAAAALTPGELTVYLDAPVSNSGRLAALMRQACPNPGWQVTLTPSPDRLLKSVRSGVIASGDAGILDECDKWFDLVAWTFEQHRIECWCLDLRIS